MGGQHSNAQPNAVTTTVGDSVFTCTGEGPYSGVPNSNLYAALQYSNGINDFNCDGNIWSQKVNGVTFGYTCKSKGNVPGENLFIANMGCMIKLDQTAGSFVKAEHSDGSYSLFRNIGASTNAYGAEVVPKLNTTFHEVD